MPEPETDGREAPLVEDYRRERGDLQSIETRLESAMKQLRLAREANKNPDRTPAATEPGARRLGSAISDAIACTDAALDLAREGDDGA